MKNEGRIRNVLGEPLKAVSSRAATRALRVFPRFSPLSMSSRNPLLFLFSGKARGGYKCHRSPPPLPPVIPGLDPRLGCSRLRGFFSSSDQRFIKIRAGALFDCQGRGTARRAPTIGVLVNHAQCIESSRDVPRGSRGISRGSRTRGSGVLVLERVLEESIILGWLTTNGLSGQARQ